MAAQEGERALLCEVPGVGLETRALGAAEAVASALVDVNLHLGLGRADRLHVAERDARVLLAEMELNRAVEMLGAGRGDTAAVPAHRSPERVRPGRAPPGDRAAPAIADDAERPGPERACGGLDVGDDAGFRHLGAQLAAAGHVL